MGAGGGVGTPAPEIWVAPDTPERLGARDMSAAAEVELGATIDVGVGACTTVVVVLVLAATGDGFEPP